MIKNFRIVLVITITISLACWKKQENEITAPETPVYTVYGQLIASLTGEPVDSALVSLVGNVKYIGQTESEKFTAETVTAADGSFRFKDVPGGYMYVLSAKKQGYNDFNKNIVTYYEDKNLDELIIETLFEHEQTATFDNYKITGLTILDNLIYIADSSLRRITKLSGDLLASKDMWCAPIQPGALTDDNEFFWLTDPSLDSIYKMGAEAEELMIRERYPASGHPTESELTIDFNDMEWDNGKIWGISDQLKINYARFSANNPDDMVLYDCPKDITRPKGVTLLKTNILLLFEYNNMSKIYIIDSNNQNIKGYFLVAANAGTIVASEENFWIAKESTITQFSSKPLNFIQ